MSGVRFYVLSVTIFLSFSLFFLSFWDTVVELVGLGSVINAADPTSFVMKQGLTFLLHSNFICSVITHGVF